MKKIISFITFLAILSQFTFPVSAAEEAIPTAMPNLVEGKTGLVYYTTSKAVAYDAETEVWTATAEELANASNPIVRFIHQDKFKHNETYYIEAKLKYADGEDRNGAPALSIEGSAGAGGTGEYISGGNISGEWKTFVFRGTTKSGVAGASDGDSIGSIHIGFNLPSKNYDVEIKDIVIRKYTGDITVTTSGVENGATVKAIDGAVITYNFSGNRPYKVEEENISVSPAATVRVAKVNDMQYTVTLSGLVKDTDYTVSLVNVQDMYATLAFSTLTFTTKTEPNPVVSDDLENLEVGADYVEVGAYQRNANGTRNVCTVQYDEEVGKYLSFDASAYIGAADEFAEVGISLPGISGADIVTIKFNYKLEHGYAQGAHFYCGTTINAELDPIPSGYYNVEGQTSSLGYSAKGGITSGYWHDITAVISIANQNYDLYVDGAKVISDAKFRDYNTVSSVGNISLFMNKSDLRNKKFGVANLRAYIGDYAPTEAPNEYIEAIAKNAEKPLTDITTSWITVKNALPDAYAMFEGYTYGYSAGKYEQVSNDEHLAPVLYDGTVFAPAGYVAKALGGTYSDGTITAGGKSFAFAEGMTSEICEKAPVVVGNELYIPVTNTLAIYFGSSAFVDERGMAIIGISETPGEQVIRCLLYELRNNSAIFGEGVKSEVLFCSRSWQSDDKERKGRYSSYDATKRFMSTSNRWTYHTDENNIKRFKDLGSIVQSGLNAVPVTIKVDEETGKELTCNHANGCTEPWYVASSIDFDGTVRVRPNDKLHGWGCTNNLQYLEDMIGKAEDGIDMGQYLWQFDDQSLNSAYGCYCDDCLKNFTTWLQEEKEYKTYRDLYNNYDAGKTQTVSGTINFTISGYAASAEHRWTWYEGGGFLNKPTFKVNEEKLDTPIDEFNYRDYLKNVEGFSTNSEALSYYSNGTRLGKAYKEFSSQKVMEFHENLRAAMDAYAEEKGLKIFMSCNNGGVGGAVKTTAGMYYLMDGGIGESNPDITGAAGIYASRFSEQAFDAPFVNSLWVKQGKTTMQLWESAIPLMYATGQFGLMPWDDWVYNTTRFFCTPEELAGNYTFVRENSDLFDNYEAPEEVGYILSLEADNSIGLTNDQIMEYARALGKKGVASRVIGVRGESKPYLTVDEEDLKGLKALVIVNNSTDAQSDVIKNSGITPVSYTYSSSTQMNELVSESTYWTAKVQGTPDDCFAVLRKNSVYKNAPVIIHAVNFASVNKENTNILVNNNYLPEGDIFTVKFHSPRNNTYTKEISKGADGTTTITIPELDNWVVMEVYGDNTQSVSRFDVDGMTGMGLGSRVSFDSAKGTEKDFTITTYGEGINTYTKDDMAAGQDEAGYVYKYVTNDDFDIVAQVSSETGEFGIMVREDLYSNAASVTLSYSYEKGLRLGKREKTDMAMHFREYEGNTPQYMRLSFKNNRVTAFISTNGVNWTELGSTEVFFEPMTAGVFATSADGTKTECRVKGFTLSGTDHKLHSSLQSTNLMEGRNPSFLDGLLMDYSAGFDGIWSKDYAGKDLAKSANETSTVFDRVISQSSDVVGASLKLTNRSNGEEGVWYRFLPVENGKTYEASCWAKVDSGVNATGAIVVQEPIDVADSNGKKDTSRAYTGKDVSFTTDFNGTATLSDEWTKVYTRFTVSPTGQVGGVDIRFKTDTACDVYLDNFELREVKSIGDNLNGVVIGYDRYSVFEISTKDGSARKIRYSAIVRKPDEFGNERVVSVDTQTIEVTGATTRIEVVLKEIGSYAEIYLWDAETNAPINRTFKIRRTF